jgi:hypothetical protein
VHVDRLLDELDADVLEAPQGLDRLEYRPPSLASTRTATSSGTSSRIARASCRSFSSSKPNLM